MEKLIKIASWIIYILIFLMLRGLYGLEATIISFLLTVAIMACVHKRRR